MVKCSILSGESRYKREFLAFNALSTQATPAILLHLTESAKFVENTRVLCTYLASLSNGFSKVFREFIGEIQRFSMGRFEISRRRLRICLARSKNFPPKTSLCYHGKNNRGSVMSSGNKDRQKEKLLKFSGRFYYNHFAVVERSCVRRYVTFE